jgi:hypothetical protein
MPRSRVLSPGSPTCARPEGRWSRLSGLRRGRGSPDRRHPFALRLWVLSLRLAGAIPLRIASEQAVRASVGNVHRRRQKFAWGDEVGPRASTDRSPKVQVAGLRSGDARRDRSG